MKKSLKTFALIVVAFTAGEFVTMWRLQTTPTTFREFTKSYIGAQPAGLKRSYHIGQLLGDAPDAGKRELKKLIFPNRPSQ